MVKTVKMVKMAKKAKQVVELEKSSLMSPNLMRLKEFTVSNIPMTLKTSLDFIMAKTARQVHKVQQVEMVLLPQLR